MVPLKNISQHVYKEQLLAMARAMVAAVLPQVDASEVDTVALDVLRFIPRCRQFRAGGDYGQMTVSYQGGKIHHWDFKHTEVDPLEA